MKIRGRKLALSDLDKSQICGGIHTLERHILVRYVCPQNYKSTTISLANSTIFLAEYGLAEFYFKSFFLRERSMFEKI